MQSINYSRQHRGGPGSPVRICVACDESVPSQQRNPYRTKPGSAVEPTVVFRGMPGFERRSRRSHWGVVADDSCGSELPDSAGDFAIKIAGCRQPAEFHPRRCSHFRDISLGSDHLSDPAVKCVVRAPTTNETVQATQTVHRGGHPRNWSDARGLPDCSAERVTNAGPGQKCLGPARARKGICGPLKRQSLRVSLRRTPWKRHAVCGSSATPERNLHPPNQGN